MNGLGGKVRGGPRLLHVCMNMPKVGELGVPEMCCSMTSDLIKLMVGIILGALWGHEKFIGFPQWLLPGLSQLPIHDSRGRCSPV